jgi:hypothetical protein
MTKVKVVIIKRNPPITGHEVVEGSLCKPNTTAIVAAIANAT